MMNRRDVLSFAASTGAASVFLSGTAQSADEESLSFRSIDTNISLFRWPFRRLPLDETDALVRKLRSFGIVQAWAGSFEGILNRDIAGVNERLAEACRDYPELIPFGSINPQLPDWEEDLRRCIDLVRRASFGNSEIYVTRTGPRTARGAEKRFVFPRCRDVCDAHRAPAVSQR